jgi:uncharacterized repeat protein (TIGR01451 family)
VRVFRGKWARRGAVRELAQIVPGVGRAVSLFVIGAAALLISSANAHAQVQRSFINTSFERPVLPSNNCWSIREDDDVPGWETSEPTWTGAWGTNTYGTCGGHPDSTPVDGPIQMFRNFDGVIAPDRDQWAELNAYSGRRLYQEVCMVAGEQVQWSLYHRGRLNTDYFRFNIGPDGTGAGATTIFDARTAINGTGVVEATGLGTSNVESQSGGTTWARYSGTFTWNEDGLTTIGFQSRESGSAGNYLDHIEVRLTPYIEFQPGSSAGTEDVPTANIPAIRLSGTIDAPLTVQVTVTGGTATLGVDYTTPSGTNTFDVVVPAGEYDATQAIPIGITILEDTEMEADETLEFRVEENPALYTITGTQVCGAAPNAAVTYTIEDNDAELTLAKVVVNGDGGTATEADFTLVADGPTAFSGAGGSAGIVDVPVMAGTYTLGETAGVAGYDASTYSCSVNGGAAVEGNSISLAARDDAVCTITNDDISPNVSIAKALVAESGSIFRVPETGEILTYAITLTNTGGQASNYELVDVLDVNVTFLDASHSGTLVGGEVQWSGLTVPAQDGATPAELVVQIRVTVNPIVPGTEVTNIAKEPGPDPACPSQQCVVIPPPPDIDITKSLVTESGVQGGVAEPGEMLTYEILLTNEGGATNDYDVTDQLNAAMTFVSATLGGIHDGVQAGGAVSWTDLTVDAHNGNEPGNLLLTVEVLLANPLPTGVSEITNIAMETGGTAPSCPSGQCVTTPTQRTGLTLVKKGAFEDRNGDGLSNAGDAIVYTLTVTNAGNVVLEEVAPADPGPEFDGAPGANALSGFDPENARLEPGQEQAFTAIYTLAQSDVDAAAGVADGVENAATARGYANGDSVSGTPVESEQSLTVLVLPAATTDISIAKVALLRAIRRGEQAPFAITVSSHSDTRVNNLTVTDTMPPGFRYVEGSARVDGVEVAPALEGRRIIFDGISVPGNDNVEIELRLLALSSAGPGEHVNLAGVSDASGTALAPDASAKIEIIVESVFDCGDVIGKVFDDLNRNGYQDEGEPGLPGVRLASVEGWLITTDAHGRFHVACALLPDQRIGSNFILKLDTRTLPTGYRVTTENPRVVRLTAGKMTELNFGAAIGRVVRLDLEDGAFLPGSSALNREWEQGIAQLITILAQEHSVLRLSYVDTGGNTALAQDRLRETSVLIRERWRAFESLYRLEIEMRVESRQ